MSPDAAGSPFPSEYHAARSRFRRASGAAGASAWSWPIGPEGEGLTIDAARLGPEEAEGLVLLSSGLHGVEGPLGSAIQSGWLEAGHAGSLPKGVAVLMLHALNPFGFAHGRRFDAENIDLNRNFLPPGAEYRGSPPLYDRLAPFLNPPTPPGRFDAVTFRPRAAWILLRHGAGPVKQAIAGGQYDHPRGLFFGGHGPAATHRLLDAHLPPLVGPARRVIHLDVHTGLGPWKTETLLIDDPPGGPVALRLARTFGAERVTPAAPGGIAYRARGSLADWGAARLGIDGRTYEYACAEFGTYAAPAVLAALRAENRAAHHAPPDGPAARLARARLRECFAPADPSWRRRALDAGLSLLDRAIAHVAP